MIAGSCLTRPGAGGTLDPQEIQEHFQILGEGCLAAQAARSVNELKQIHKEDSAARFEKLEN